MNSPLVLDRFNTDFDRMFGTNPSSFKLPGERPVRADIPLHQINRTNARSVGRATYMHTKPCVKCGSLERGTWSNKCKGCV